MATDTGRFVERDTDLRDVTMCGLERRDNDA